MSGSSLVSDTFAELRLTAVLVFAGTALDVQLKLYFRVLRCTVNSVTLGLFF